MPQHGPRAISRTTGLQPDKHALIPYAQCFPHSTLQTARAIQHHLAPDIDIWLWVQLHLPRSENA